MYLLKVSNLSATYVISNYKLNDSGVIEATAVGVLKKSAPYSEGVIERFHARRLVVGGNFTIMEDPDLEDHRKRELDDLIR